MDLLNMTNRTKLQEFSVRRESPWGPPDPPPFLGRKGTGNFNLSSQSLKIC